jgi:hypothetical protein
VDASSPRSELKRAPAALLAALRDDARVLGSRGDDPTETGSPGRLSATDRYGWKAMRAMPPHPAAPASAGHATRSEPAQPLPHYQELVRQDGAAFVTSAFQLLLRRVPDGDGLAHYMGCLEAGRPKIDILREIIASPEGRWKGAMLRGLPVQTRIFRRTVELPPALARLATLGLRARPRPPAYSPAPALRPAELLHERADAPWSTELLSLRGEIERLSGIVALMARSAGGPPPSTSSDPDAVVDAAIHTTLRRLDRRNAQLHVEATLHNLGAAAWLPRSLAPTTGVVLSARRGAPGGPLFQQARNGVDLPDIVPAGAAVTVAGILDLPPDERTPGAPPDPWILDLVCRGAWLRAPPS